MILDKFCFFLWFSIEEDWKASCIMPNSYLSAFQEDEIYIYTFGRIEVLRVFRENVFSSFDKILVRRGLVRECETGWKSTLAESRCPRVQLFMRNRREELCIGRVVHERNCPWDELSGTNCPSTEDNENRRLFCLPLGY